MGIRSAFGPSTSDSVEIAKHQAGNQTGYCMYFLSENGRPIKDMKVRYIELIWDPVACL